MNEDDSDDMDDGSFSPTSPSYEPTSPSYEPTTSVPTVVPDCDETRKHKNIFTPHLSVGQVKRRNELDALIAEFQAGWTPLIFQATCVDLIWRNDRPDDIFRVGYSVSLGTGDVQRVKM